MRGAWRNPQFHQWRSLPSRSAGSENCSINDTLLRRERRPNLLVSDHRRFGNRSGRSGSRAANRCLAKLKLHMQIACVGTRPGSDTQGYARYDIGVSALHRRTMPSRSTARPPSLPPQLQSFALAVASSAFFCERATFRWAARAPRVFSKLAAVPKGPNSPLRVKSRLAFRNIASHRRPFPALSTPSLLSGRCP